MTEQVYQKFERWMIGHKVEIGMYDNNDTPCGGAFGRLFQVQDDGHGLIGVYFGPTDNADMTIYKNNGYCLITADPEDRS
jgi:hypothetical protein